MKIKYQITLETEVNPDDYLYKDEGESEITEGELLERVENEFGDRDLDFIFDNPNTEFKIEKV